MQATLLVELLTEELPPKSLKEFDYNFYSSLFEELGRLKLVAPTVVPQHFATPRRLAILVPKVHDRVAGGEKEVLGPSIKSGLDADGKPTAALIGFAKKNGVAIDSLERRSTPKGDVFAARTMSRAVELDVVLADLVEKVLKKLPSPKVMRWSNGDAQFVRPVHNLIMLHGKRVVPGKVLGLDSNEKKATRGHRFMGNGEIVLENADEYEVRLRDHGKVIARFDERESRIGDELRVKATALRASLGSIEDTALLLNEVTALVEHPSVYVGEFDKTFLEVPQECLILTMRQHQKFFPLFDATGTLLPKFLIVSNMEVSDSSKIVGGNQRVMRPRLEDARFFYDQDRKVRLEERVPQLAKVVYHNKLGTQRERVDRIKLLAGEIARKLKADSALAERAAELSKADLLTGMVGEFPELQGTMGRYYALHDKEPGVVADAIEAHYRPRFAGDKLPEGPVACAVALGDKLDTLAGLFSIGEQPTGDKDPFGLRRAALGVIRIFVENQLPLSLWDLINAAFEPFKGKAQTDLRMFFTERMRSYFHERGYTANEVEAVLSLNPAEINLVLKQLEAVRAFAALPEAASLAAANKRIANILRQAESKGESFVDADVSALKEPAETSLYQALQAATRTAKPLFESGDFAGYLKTFASLKSPVDSFFDAVMVMVDDRKLRENRLALLTDMRKAMNRFADISKLAA